ncbi:MAG: nitrogenase component 1 [Lachnospiraceae bacterium]|nr:nitrogenase component 1 [Lachnospiraceae bacterium]
MLRRLKSEEIDFSKAVIPIGEAAYPAPFRNALEYNCPVHEHWNIVHTGMLVPETHQIYVGSRNCLRGVIMTADEAERANRISCVQIEERDVYQGKLERLTIEGVKDVIEHLPYRPRAIELFLVCMHHMLGSDERYIFAELEKMFPDIDFMRCWMDPAMQKIATTPEERQRRSMMTVLPPLERNPNLAALLGENIRMPDDSDQVRFLEKIGCRLVQVQDCDTYDDYLQFGKASVFLTRSAFSVKGIRAVSEKLGRKCLYLPPAFSGSEMREQLLQLCEALGFCGDAEETVSSFLEEGQAEAEREAEQTLSLIGQTEVSLDAVALTRPLSAARWLLTHGFAVKRVYLDGVSKEEEADFYFLQKAYPELLLCATIRPELRRWQRNDSDGKVLAIGPKAAFFNDTPWFVNTIENGGNWGYSGISQLMREMRTAFSEKKDTEAIVPQKGLGCSATVR